MRGKRVQFCTWGWCPPAPRPASALAAFPSAIDAFFAGGLCKIHCEVKALAGSGFNLHEPGADGEPLDDFVFLQARENVLEAIGFDELEGHVEPQPNGRRGFCFHAPPSAPARLRYNLGAAGGP